MRVDQVFVSLTQVQDTLQLLPWPWQLTCGQAWERLADFVESLWSDNFDTPEGGLSWDRRLGVKTEASSRAIFRME